MTKWRRRHKHGIADENRDRLGERQVADLELQTDNSRAVRSREEGHVSAHRLILKWRNDGHYRQHVMRNDCDWHADDESGQDTGKNPECASQERRLRKPHDLTFLDVILSTRRCHTRR